MLVLRSSFSSHKHHNSNTNMNTLITAINNILASISASVLVSYSLLCSKLLDASDYIQEQAELHFVVAKFVYQQAAPRINPLTTILIFIQSVSIVVILYVCVLAIKKKLCVSKKIKIKCGSNMEVFELVRVRMAKSSTEKPDNPKSQNNIAESSNPSASRNKPQVSDIPFIDTQAPLSNLDIAQSSSSKPKYHPIINNRKGPSYAEKARLFYETSQKLQQRNCDHLTRIDGPNRPNTNKSGKIKARTKFDLLLRSNNDPGQKRSVDRVKYLSVPYLNSALLDKQIKYQKGMKTTK